MLDERYKQLLVVAVALTLIGSVVVAGAALPSHQSDDTERTSYLRIAHASPDTGAVDVSVDDETVASNVTFGTVSEYLNLSAGTHNVTIAAANDSTQVLFDGNLSLDPLSATTIAASGETSVAAQTEFQPVVLRDDAAQPDSDTSALRIVHLSPDAGPVDIVVADGPDGEGDGDTETPSEGTETPGNETEAPGNETEAPGEETETPGADDQTVLVDGATYPNSTGYLTVPSGDYTLEIRIESEGNNGTLLGTVDASLEGGQAYTAFAAGYLNPTGIPDAETFTVITVADATTTVNLPNGGAAPPTPTPGEMTPTPSEGTETPGNETETPGNETETPGEETETPSEGTETPSEGTETPSEGTETPSEGTETPSEGTETPGEETETPSEGTETPAEGTDTAGEGTETGTS